MRLKREHKSTRGRGSLALSEQMLWLMMMDVYAKVVQGPGEPPAGPAHSVVS